MIPGLRDDIAEVMKHIFSDLETEIFQAENCLKDVFSLSNPSVF